MVTDEAYERLALQKIARLPNFSYTGPVLHLGKSAVMLGELSGKNPYIIIVEENTEIIGGGGYSDLGLILPDKNSCDRVEAVKQTSANQRSRARVCVCVTFVKGTWRRVARHVRRLSQRLEESGELRGMFWTSFLVVLIRFVGLYVL